MLVESGKLILGVDVVRVSQESDIEWNLHTWEECQTELEGWLLKSRLAGGSGGLLAVASSQGIALKWESGKSDFVPAYPNSGMRDRYLRVTIRGTDAVFVWSLSFTGVLPEMELSRSGDVLWLTGGVPVAVYDGTWITRK